MNDILAGYSSSGLASTAEADDVDDDEDDDATPRRNASVLTLERSWTDVVRDHDSLDKRQRDYQEAVWELLSTELEHISKLRLVVDVRIMSPLLSLSVSVSVPVSVSLSLSLSRLKPKRERGRAAALKVPNFRIFKCPHPAASASSGPHMANCSRGYSYRLLKSACVTSDCSRRISMMTLIAVDS